MTFDKTAYMRSYMAERRANRPASRMARMKFALETIILETQGKTGPSAVMIQSLAQDALAK